ncbi:MAG: DUF1579 domain-containing protein [Candidatus Eisenbacteria bacterium]|nr:DUF1579 domain-containing protein [Candidatus Eisenbacteria bacterium]
MQGSANPPAALECISHTQRSPPVSLPDSLQKLTGRWTGTNRLWLTPTDPVRESESSMTVAPAAKGRFLTLSYTWSDGGKPQEGMVLLGAQPDKNLATCAWVDSWHMQDVMMICKGALDGQGGVALDGSYAAPPGPDWGWRLGIHPNPDGTFTLRMHNIPPGGVPVLAVETDYRRTD